MTRRLISDISASTIQVIVNQFLGLLIFVVTSRFLSKSTYGEMNWSLAVLTFVTTILSLRLEQIVVRRIAAGDNPAKMLTLFTGHVVVTGILFYTVLLASSFLFPSFFNKHDLVLVFAISHLLSFFSSPFKQLANGREKFRILAVMASVANLVRAIWLLVIIAFFNLTVEQVLIIYIVSSFAELIMCLLISRYKLGITFGNQYRLAEYFILIKESLPLAGAVILNASIARIDWILLGLFTTPEKTAEYSFAYKVFELSPLPLLILAPVLLSRFSRFFGVSTEHDLLARSQDISLLIRTEMIVATFIPLVLNLVWTPVIDAVTAGKYGAANSLTFLILSCCIPFLYINNLLWTIEFAQNRLKRIFRITLVTFIVILTGDLIFIPIYHVNGAALVYLFATIIEYGNYMRVSAISTIRETWLAPILCIMAAIFSGYISTIISDVTTIRLLVAVPVFSLLLILTNQLRKDDIRYIFHAFRSKSPQPFLNKQ